MGVSIPVVLLSSIVTPDAGGWPGTTDTGIARSGSISIENRDGSGRKRSRIGGKHDGERRSMAQYWLLKSEPKDYSYEDLERDQRTVWDGVSNRLALKYLNRMCPGDQAFIYHTGRIRGHHRHRRRGLVPLSRSREGRSHVDGGGRGGAEAAGPAGHSERGQGGPSFRRFHSGPASPALGHARVRYRVAAVAGDVRHVESRHTSPDDWTCHRRTGSSSWPCSLCWKVFFR